MRYELKISAICGDVIPLRLVAEAMARAASTAYGKTPPHKPIFDYQLPTQTKHLLNEARAGRLHVCNQDGVQGAADEIIAAAKSSGDLSEVRRYLEEPGGATEIDWDTTNILILYSKLHCLNEWGKTKGDSFFISDEPVGWIDERGYMNPTDTPAAKGGAVPAAKAGTNKKKWGDAELRALWEESIMPSVTQASLATKHGVSRQRIAILIGKAKGKFSTTRTHSGVKNSYGQLIK